MAVRTTSLFLLGWILVSLAGCASVQTGSGSQAANASQPDPRLTQSAEAKFFSKSGLQACAGGAVVGVITCKLTNTCDSDKGLLTAAAVGCGIGMGTNYYLDQRRAEYSNQEQRLNVMLADVREDNRKLATLTTTAETVLDQDRQTLAQLESQIQKEQIEQQKAQQVLAQVDANTQYLNQSLVKLKQREQQWQDVVKQERQQNSDVESLQEEVERMQEQIISLQEDISDVEQSRRTIVLG